MEGLFLVEYSFDWYPYHIYLYHKHISNTILLNSYYVSKISICFLCLKILNITDMVEVFFDLYPQISLLFSKGTQQFWYLFIII